MKLIYKILIGTVVALAYLGTMGYMRILSNEPTPRNAILFNLFSLFDLLTAVALVLIVVYSINKGFRKRR